MSHKSHVVTALSLLISALGGMVAGCANERRPEPAIPEAVSDVSVIVAQRTNVPDWLEAVGTVRAARFSEVASQTTGNIVEIRVHEGDRVQRGEILATIDDSQPHAAVEQATAAETAAQKEVSVADSNLALAAATLKRYQQLYERKSVSPQEFDEIQARYQSAEARRDVARAEQARANAALTQARTSLGYAQIRAPFAGVVTAKGADVGTLASPGLPIFTVEATRNYRLEATVDESDIRIARIGQVVPVAVDSLGGIELRGKVSQIVPAADSASRSFLVKIDLPSDARIRSGLFGRARFARGERSTLVIPRSAVVERGQLQGIYVIDANQIAGLRYVTLGNADGQQVEVLSGLQDGERLIATPGDRELGGKRIATRQ
jgi:RND family efflux transporter MFP subunit